MRTTLKAALLISALALSLMLLHGAEAAIWAGAYLAIGAIGSEKAAMLFSVATFTTRGASGLELAPDWRLMGALEAADGMLLFGVSTAFIFAGFQRVLVSIDPQASP